MRDGRIHLLIFDPKTSKADIEKFIAVPHQKAHLFRRNLQSFQKPVYQILVVRGLLSTNEREVKYFIQEILIHNEYLFY